MSPVLPTLAWVNVAVKTDADAVVSVSEMLLRYVAVNPVNRTFCPAANPEKVPLIVKTLLVIENVVNVLLVIVPASNKLAVTTAGVVTVDALSVNRIWNFINRNFLPDTGVQTGVRPLAENCAVLNIAGVRWKKLAAVPVETIFSDAGIPATVLFTSVC